MAESAAELIKRAFSKFGAVAKRAGQPAGVVELDLGKIGVELGKAGAALGTSGDIEALEKVVDDTIALLEKAECDPTTDVVIVAKSEYAERFAVDKAADAGGMPKFAPPEDKGSRYNVEQGSGPAVPPKKGSGDQKGNQYTGVTPGGGDPSGDYTQTAEATNAKTPSGGDANAAGFNQPQSKRVAAKAAAPTRKAQQPAHPETPGSPGMLLSEDAMETQEPMVSEGFGMRGKGKPAVAKRGSAEDVWARDMADMTREEVSAVRKAAADGAMAEGDADEKDEVDGDATDDKTEADAKRKAAKAKAAKAAGKAKADGPVEEVDEPTDGGAPTAAEASKPNTSGDAPDEPVDEVKAKKAAASEAPDQDVDRADDEEGDAEPDEDDDEKKKAAKAKKAGKPFPGAAKPFGAKGKKDEEGDEDEAKKAATAKASQEVDWERDLSPPADAMILKSRRRTAAEVAVSPTRKNVAETSQRAAALRKSAMEAEESDPDADAQGPADGSLSADQVAAMEKRGKLTAEQRRRKRVKELEGKGYTQGAGYQPGMVDGVED